MQGNRGGLHEPVQDPGAQAAHRAPEVPHAELEEGEPEEERCAGGEAAGRNWLLHRIHNKPENAREEFILIELGLPRVRTLSERANRPKRDAEALTVQTAPNEDQIRTQRRNLERHRPQRARVRTIPSHTQTTYRSTH